MKNSLSIFVRTAVLLILLSGFVVAESSNATAPITVAAPRVLIVVAHPDDESCFAATVYEITHNLGGTVDQLVVTNGEGGYRYSLLAESFYGIALTNEAVGHAALPEIRKRELLEAGRILGVGNHFFLDQRDLRYTQDIDEVLREHWQPGVVLPELQRRIAGGNYDFILTLFPSPKTHGGHKAATISALNAVQQLAGRKPVVLGCQTAQSGTASQPSWEGFQSAQHPFSTLPMVFKTDRGVKFGFQNALDYQIIVNWVIAAHKSQGAFQMGVNRADLEEFMILEDGGIDEIARTAALFQALAAQAPHPLGAAASCELCGTTNDAGSVHPNAR